MVKLFTCIATNIYIYMKSNKKGTFDRADQEPHRTIDLLNLAAVPDWLSGSR
jgi:hypothetical protein